MMKIIRKYPKKSKFSNFRIKMYFDISLENLIYEIRGTKIQSKGFVIEKDNTNYNIGKSLYFYGTKEECINNENLLLLKQEEFDKYIERLKRDKKIKKETNRIDKVIKYLESDKEDFITIFNDDYEIELEYNTKFWNDNDKSDNVYPGLGDIIKHAKREEKFKRIINK